MKKFLDMRFLVFGVVLLVGVFFISQAISGRVVSDLNSRGLIIGESEEELLSINTGAVSGWAQLGEFPTPREKHSVVFWDGYAYVLGGTIGWAFDGAVTSSVLYSRYNEDTGFDVWRYGPNIPGEANFDGAAFAANGFVYVLGGSDKVNHSTSSVWFSRINPDHSLQGWINTTPLPISLSYHDVVYRNGFVYTIGGKDLNTPNDLQTKKVYYAQVQGDGSLGEWVETVSLPTPTSGHEAVINGNYVYVFGGADASGYPVNLVSYSSINSDGGLGKWGLGNPLPVMMVNFHAESLGGYVYIFGGSGLGINAMDSVYYAKTNANGSLSAWTKTASMPIKLSRNNGFIVGQKAVIVGGMLDSIGPGNVSRAILSAFVDAMAR